MSWKLNTFVSVATSSSNRAVTSNFNGRNKAANHPLFRRNPGPPMPTLETPLSFEAPPWHD